ncbi:dihydroorotate dehydrogenase-like protein [Reinekea marinisedimentorum]|uniref:Dihydroorotate dehydrogenase (Fumarate) n=1 Tax=Reinekea marinisedimentorum TaxID=230495 RepID=A0A4R3IC24_9GAMM|nr:dihydroorotate dehydrogenase-like protein [Reinekea marinisedimentorum]TCS42068.1 dihydroorotate dehydrogenase (fumarate) [Reinekea marinisedimentorum]
MTNLTTTYLGLTLKNPLVPSSSPFTKKLDTAKQLEDAGAGAIIMHSLFEEEVTAHQKVFASHLADNSFGFAEMDNFLPEPTDYEDVTSQYLKTLTELKSALDIPVIASINGIGSGEWLSVAKDIQQAGANALEVNLYSVPSDTDKTSSEIEKKYLQIVNALKAETTLPLTFKLSDQFSSPGNFVKQLEAAGANGVSLFNRFYQPDVDLDTGQVYPSLNLSNKYEYLRALHWIALLYNQTGLSLGATGGVHNSATVLKLIGSGANVVHTTSALLSTGPSTLTQWQTEIEQWLEEQELELEDFRGRYSMQQLRDPAVFERVNYYQNLQLYRR